MLANDTTDPSISAAITEFDTPAPPLIVNPMTRRFEAANARKMAFGNRTWNGSRASSGNGRRWRN